MKIANIEFNVNAMANVTREEFIERYQGRLKADINYAADLLDRYFKKENGVAYVDFTPAKKKRKKR